MTDIYIKSFNRPHYLDRCIGSAKKFVRGRYRITVLDDGTPQKYLEKIKLRHPDAIIRTSENYDNKVRAIEENLSSGAPVNGFEIPVNLWTDAAKNGSDYFIMTEDDVWFTAEIDADHLAEVCRKHKTSLLKLGWLGNFLQDRDLNITEINSGLVAVQPRKLILSSEKFMEAFFYNRYKMFTALYKLKLVDNATKQKYWALNSILMGFYEKEYWLKIWDKMDGKVDEKRQLINASVYYRKHRKNPAFVCRLKNEAMRTTFQSSATNSYHEYGFEFDVNKFNHILNEAWLRGDFDAMQNFPKDFSDDYLEKFISKEMNVGEFRKWTEKFREQYRNLGCKVDY